MNQANRNRFWTLLEPVYGDLAALSAQLSHDNGGDLLQDVILRVMDKLPALKDEEKFKAWMARILIRESRRRRRARMLKSFLGLDELERVLHGESDGPDHLQRMHFKSALHALKADRREVLLLHYMASFSLKEIAEMNRESLSAVKTRISRARRELRALLEGRLPLAAISRSREEELDHVFQQELDGRIPDQTAKECA